MITEETRREAHGRVDKVKRNKQIIECLQERNLMTAKEIAVRLHEKGYTPSDDRNFAAPRITEMIEAGIVEPAGKTTCRYTGRKVAVFTLTEA